MWRAQTTGDSGTIAGNRRREADHALKLERREGARCCDIGGASLAERVALITGVTGQDGAYLAEFLLEKGYVVHGIKRRASSFNTERIDHLYVDPHERRARFFIHYGDMTDSTSLIRILQETGASEIYNLAAQSHVQVSFETAEYTGNADALGALRMLEAIRILRMEDKTRYYQASTSEMYGLSETFPQNENTPFRPRSPYAAAKLYAYWITVNYREAFGMHASNGILFNHEGPTRGETFVTRKITRAVAAIQCGVQQRLYLGNLDARRGAGIEETGVDAKSGETLVLVDGRYFRPTEIEVLQGDPTKAREKLGWRHKTEFAALVREMVDSDVEAIKRERRGNGG